MMYKVFPHLSLDTKDDSLTILENIELLPLFRPVYVMKTEKGEIGVPTFCPNYTHAVSKFGAATFDKNNKKYFCRDSVFLLTQFPYCGAFIIRLDDESMARASSVLELKLTTASNGAITWRYETRKIDYANVEAPETLDNISRKAVVGMPSTSIDADNLPAEVVDPMVSFDGGTTFVETAAAQASAPEAVVELGAIVGHKLIVKDDTGAADFGSIKLGFLANIEDVSAVKARFVTTVVGGNLTGLNQTIWADATVLDADAETYISKEFSLNAHREGTELFLNLPALVENCDYVELLIQTVNAEIPVVSTVQVNAAMFVFVISATTVTIPLMGLEAKYVGEYGNSLTYNLRPDYNRTDYSEMRRLKSFVQALSFGEYKSNSSLMSVIATKYGTQSFNFLFDSTIIDPSINADLGITSSVNRYFGTEYPEPMNCKVYEANVAKAQLALKQIAYVVSQNDGDYKNAAKYIYDMLTATPNQIDLLRLTTVPEDASAFAEAHGPLSVTTAGYVDIARICGITYVDASETNGGLTASQSIRLKGGSNGALDNAFNGTSVEFEGEQILDSADGTINNSITIEQKIADVWNTAHQTFLVDAPRFPFNMIIDSGHRLFVKKAMISVTACRTDVKPVLSTWDGQVSNQDIAMSVVAGGDLIQSIRLIKDSEIYNTGANRGVIFGQVGYIAGELYKDLLPHTLWYVQTIAFMHNGDFIRENPEGRSAKDKLFVKSLWIPFNDLSKKNLWGANVNYSQHFNMTQTHYPSIKSVYEHESSLFVNDAFVNKVIYIKQLAPAIWANHSGRTDPNEVVYADALEELDAKLSHLLNGTATTVTRMYQTAAEKASGFEHHIEVALYDSLGQRIWHMDIVARRRD